MSALKAKDHAIFLRALGCQHQVYLDELKTFIHTHCRPVTVCFAVTTKRKILGFDVSPCVPNSRRLIAIARKKYGPPRDEGPEGFRRLLTRIKPFVAADAKIITDEHPAYPLLIHQILPGCTLKRHRSKRAAVAGQGELKEKGYDPLFAINHTFAMIRAHVSRLVRSTWCTSKTIQGLVDHLNLYVHYHNTVLT